MAGVNVESLSVQIGGAGAQFLNPLNLGTLWEDDFGVSGQSISDVRENYLFMGETDNITPSISGVTNGLRFTSSLDTGGEPMVTWCPRYMHRSVNGADQFCESIIKQISVNMRGGPSVFVKGDGHLNTLLGFCSQYIFNLVAGGNSNIQSRVNNVTANIGASFVSPVVDDKVALTIKVVAGQHILEVFYNEVSQGTRIVGAPTVDTAGGPGLCAYTIAVAPTIEHGFLRCGLLKYLGY